MMSIINQKIKKIKEIIKEKIKEFLKFLISDIGFFILLLILISLISFFLGRLSVMDNIKKKENKKPEIILMESTEKSNDILLVASKKGKVYHFPWCSGAVRLKEENKIFFKNKEEAERKGYSPAKNCEGL